MKRRFLIFLLLGFSMMEIASGQGELMRSRIEREKEREKQRQEQKEAALPQPAILGEDLVVPTLNVNAVPTLQSNEIVGKKMIGLLKNKYRPPSIFPS